MAIEYTLLCKDKRLSKEVLVRKIESLGFQCSKIELLDKGICIHLNEQIGFWVFLLDAGNYPYNSWETIFSSEDFTFERILKFRMVKDYSYFEERYNVLLRMVFDLTAELNEEALLVNSSGTEMCFFRENEPILFNNEARIWNNDSLKNIERWFIKKEHPL